jgi:hypothetical protein
MTDFIVTITDPIQLEGITWAREQYNATLPPPPPPSEPSDTVTGGMTETVTPPVESDEAYVQRVMEQAAISYADQKLRSEYQAHYENELEARKASKS